MTPQANDCVSEDIPIVIGHSALPQPARKHALGRRVIVGSLSCLDMAVAIVGGWRYAIINFVLGTEVAIRKGAPHDCDMVIMSPRFWLCRMQSQYSGSGARSSAITILLTHASTYAKVFFMSPE